MSDFQREERYVVVKLSRLSPAEQDDLRSFIADEDLPTEECVVVESDWPNYEDTWKAVQQVEAGMYEPGEKEKLQSELTAARDEVERLRVQLSDMTGCACDAESFCKYHAMTTASGRSIVLRKQAEAVERLASHYSIKSMSGNYIWKEAAIEEATRLLDQADSLENGE